ncbi:MAG: hypothetical protein OXC68_05740 [Aestuariivita sp.]|nr:hypothetical protein [Aestuariivita sp.]
MSKSIKLIAVVGLMVFVAACEKKMEMPAEAEPISTEPAQMGKS